MAKIKSILFYYNIAFIFCLLIIGVFTKNIFNLPGLLVIIVPLIIYFWGYLLINSKKFKTPQNYFFWVFVSILLIFNFLSTFLLFVTSIFFSKSIFDVIISILYLPFSLYFFLTIFGWYKKVQQNNSAQIKIAKLEKVETATGTTIESPPKIDLDRRRFLKILGGTGVSVFLLSLINPKQAGAAFFGSVPGPGTVSLKDANGAKINPAERQPTDGYKISQLDDNNYPYYYGYINSTGAWYIMREDESSNYRYVKGSSNFSLNWTGRGALTYDYFDSVF
jgi:hypothetical protein